MDFDILNRDGVETILHCLVGRVKFGEERRTLELFASDRVADGYSICILSIIRSSSNKA